MEEKLNMIRRVFKKGSLVKIYFEGKFLLGCVVGIDDDKVVLLKSYEVVVLREGLMMVYVGKFFCRGNFAVFDLNDDELSMYKFVVENNLKKRLFGYEGSVSGDVEFMGVGISKMVH